MADKGEVIWKKNRATLSNADDSFEQAILLQPAALPNLEAVEDEAGADEDEEDGFIAAKLIVLEPCDPVFVSGVLFSIYSRNQC